MLKNKNGVSMISLVITIIVIIILSSVALSNSSDMIDDSIIAVNEADKTEDNDTIRKLITDAVIDRSSRIGIAL